MCNSSSKRGRAAARIFGAAMHAYHMTAEHCLPCAHVRTAFAMLGLGMLVFQSINMS